MDIEQQLRAALAPCKPRQQLRAGILARLTTPGASMKASNRSNSRIILAGTIVAVAAAAAMLIVQMRGDSAPQSALAEPQSVATSEPVVGIADEPAAAPVSPEPVATAQSPAPAEAITPVKPFTVSVLPLQNQAGEEVAKTAIDTFHAAFLAELRRVPGLLLVLSDGAERAAEDTPDFELTVTGSVPADPGKFNASVSSKEKRMLLEEQRMRREGRAVPAGAMFVSIMTGDIAPPCAAGVTRTSPKCTGPEGLAAQAVLRLRKRNFPADPSLRLMLQQQLLDASLEPRERLEALTDLVDLRGGAAAAGALQEAEVIRGAIQLAAATSDPALRAQIWRAMRGSRHLEVLQAAIAALGQDPAPEVRLQAIAVLQEGFVENPRARGALEAAAREEARPLLRALAQRALSGETSWSEYVVQSLKDTRRTDAERLEAFLYDAFPAGRSPGSIIISPQSSRSLHALDDEALRLVARLMPAAPRVKEAPRLMSTFVNQLGALDRPAVIPLLLDLAANSPDQNTRYAAVNQLASRRDDSRVQAQLDKLASTAADPRLRELAAAALQGTSQQQMQPGVQLRMQPGGL